MSGVVITCDIKKRDLWWANVSLLYRNRFLLRGVLVLLALLLVLLGLGEELNWVWISFAVVVSVVYFVVLFAVLAVFFGAFVLFGKHRGVVGVHTLEITNDGLKETTDVNETLIRWSGFYSVVSTKRYVWINLTEMICFAVPKRCFASAAEADEFVAELKRRINGARGKPALTSPGA